MRSITFHLSTLSFIAGIAFMFAALPSNAARDISTPPSLNSAYQLLVLEVDRCIYCQLFRRDVLPTYQSTTHAKSVPIRFVDLDRGSLDAFHLKAPIDTVPTIVLLHKKREVGRLAGHIGPETFIHAVTRMLSKTH